MFLLWFATGYNIFDLLSLTLGVYFMKLWVGDEGKAQLYTKNIKIYSHFFFSRVHLT